MLQSEYASQLTAVGLRLFPCRAHNKAPAIPRDSDWKDIARQGLDLSIFDDGRTIPGVPVPMGILVIDLDTYKGITRQDVENALSCALPWDYALMQYSQHGGQHYGFRIHFPGRTGSNLRSPRDRSVELVGLDCRSDWAGYICTGTGYTPAGVTLLAMGNGGVMLPELPDEARWFFEKQVHEAPASTDAPTDVNETTIIEALHYIDPAKDRSAWVRVMLSLRSAYDDGDAERGYEIFRAWSAGEYTPDGQPPANYVEEDCRQFFSAKTTGGLTIGTLFYEAIDGGWAPVNTIDLAAAFGEHEAEKFTELLDRVNESGADAKTVPELVDEIRSSGLKGVARAMLHAELLRQLKEAGLLTKSLRNLLDSSNRAPTMPSAPAIIPECTEFSQLDPAPLSRASAVHGVNAQLLQVETFAGRMALRQGLPVWWNGRQWEIVPSEQLERVVFKALLPDQAKSPNVSGTIRALIVSLPEAPEQAMDRRVYFRNCVLDLDNLTTYPHARENGNLGTLQVDFLPGSPCNELLAHLDSVFGGLEDGEDRKKLAQEVLGWTLFSDLMNIQKVVAIDGPPRAGKGILAELAIALHGEHGCGIANFSDLASGKTQSAFRGFQICVDSEAKPPRRDDIKKAIGFLNKLASNELVSIELLNTQTPWRGRMYCKYMFACNGIPGLLDDSGAVASRIHILKYDRSFCDREDFQLLSRLKKELPGIALWALDGAVRLLANHGRFTVPESTRMAQADLASDSQPLLDFVREYLEIVDGERISSSDLWRKYQEYAARDNAHRSSRPAFIRSLRQTIIDERVQWRDSMRIDGKNTSGFEGLHLKDGVSVPDNLVVMDQMKQGGKK